MRFSLSGFDELNFTLVNEMKNNSFLFHEEIIIDNFFGTFNNIPWNGGRIDVGIPTSLPEAEAKIKRINDLGIGVRFTFSNLLLEEKHLGDFYANSICEIAHNELNSITIGSEVLREYLRKTYPKYRLVSSITNVNRDPDWIKEQLGLFEYVVLPIEFNRDLEMISSLPNKEKIEILVNESCTPFCKIKKQHYLTTSRVNLSYTLEENSKESQKMWDACPMDKSTSVNLTWEEIKQLNDIGVDNFKFLGRKMPFGERRKDMINTFIKEEHHEHVQEIELFN